MNRLMKTCLLGSEAVRRSSEYATPTLDGGWQTLDLQRTANVDGNNLSLVPMGLGTPV